MLSGKGLRQAQGACDSIEKEHREVETIKPAAKDQYIGLNTHLFHRNSLCYAISKVSLKCPLKYNKRGCAFPGVCSER